MSVTFPSYPTKVTSLISAKIDIYLMRPKINEIEREREREPKRNKAKVTSRNLLFLKNYGCGLRF